MKTKLYLTVFLLLFAVFGHAQPGQIDVTFNASGAGAFNGTSSTADCIVYKSKVYEDEGVNKDKIIIVGRFNRFNGVNKEYVARLNADGTLDTSFTGPDFGGGQYIYTAAIQPDGKIVIGGGFTVSSGGVTYQSIARLNQDGSLDTGFNAGTGTRGTASSNAVVHAITVQPDGKILFGGSFNTYNGVACKANLNRLEANGNLDTAFSSSVGAVNGEVRAIALQSGKIIVGGFFTGYTSPSTTKNKILRLNSNGTFDATFNTGGLGATGGGSGAGVYDIYVMPKVSTLPLPPGSLSEYIYVVGKYTGYNTTSKISVARLTPEGALDTSFISNLTVEESPATEDPGYGYCAFVVRPQPDGKMLIGGNFRKYNNNSVGMAKGVIRVDAAGTLDTSFLSGTGFQGGTSVYQGKSVIRDILLQSDGRIVVGGDFTTYNGTARRMLARIRTRECPFGASWGGSSWSGGISPTANHYMVVKSNTILNIPTGTHMVACELEIQELGTLKIMPGASLTVNGIVMNNGTFIVDDTASLVQVKDDAKNADLGAGIFQMNRKTSHLRGYDFVFWSSPVENQTLHNLSPLTRFDKYYKFDAVLNNWVVCNNGTEVMSEGRGYIVRAPSNYSLSTYTQFSASFFGRAQNGLTTVPIFKTATNGLNLVGNPYPSAIDAVKFLDDPVNNTKIDGTILLWSHASAISASNPGAYQHNYNSDDYISFNKTGGLAPTDSAEPFAGQIAAGQAFFVTSMVATPTSPQPVATFNNAMRITGSNNVFYKTGEVNNDSRIWVNFYNAQGAFRQTLIGYMDGATDGIDRSFDGEAASANSYVNFYSIAANKNLSIQGRALPFNENQVIPMGYKTTIAGTFSIRVGKYDGLFNNQHVYIVDKLQNTTQEIKSGVYTFTTAAGTFNDRFEIKFVNNVLAISNPAAADSNTALVMAENSEVKIQSSETIESIAVYDITGKTLYNKKGIAASTFNTGNLNVSNQVILVTVTFENKSTLTKKVMVN